MDIDLIETKDVYYVRAAVPGVEKEDVIIKNKGDLIIVIIIEDEVGRETIEKGFDKL